MSEVFCPIPWNSLSVLPDGRLRLCCHSDKDHLLNTTGDGIPLHLDQISSISDIDSNFFLKKVREQFSKNMGIPSCDSCVSSEVHGQKSIRQEVKSVFPRVRNSTNFKLEFLDISFGNFCNMQCPMCSSSYSTMWSKSLGNKDSFFSHNLKLWETPFFKNQIKNLKIVLIQGGEPLISKDHIPFLKILKESGASKNITIDYITNFSTKISKNLIELWKDFSCINLFISLEAVNSSYEYTRPPMKWVNFEKNLNCLEDLKSIKGLNIKFHFKTLIHLYNFEGLPSLIKYLHDHYEPFTESFPEFTLLNHPNHLRVEQLNFEVKNKIIKETLAVIEPLKKVHHDKVKSRQNLHSLTSILDRVLNFEQIPLDPNFWKQTKYFDIKYGLAFKTIVSDEYFNSLKSLSGKG